MVFKNDANMTPNAVGERPQGAIAAAVMRYGYTILVPFGEAHRYDMVIEKGINSGDSSAKLGDIYMEWSGLMLVVVTGGIKPGSHIQKKRLTIMRFIASTQGKYILCL